MIKILNAIYEEDFLNSSFGYRPGIGSLDAVQDLTFNLEVAPEKTRTLRFSRFSLAEKQGFEFLSFEFRWKLSYKGKPQVKRRTAPKKLKVSINNFKEWIKENRNKRLSYLFKALKSKYLGYWNYYGIHDNSKSLGRFFFHTTGAFV